MARIVKMTEMEESVFEKMPEDKHRAIGYLSTWSLNSYKFVSLFLVGTKGNPLYPNEAIVAHYYNDEKDYRVEYTIVGLWDDRHNKYSFHS